MSVSSAERQQHIEKLCALLDAVQYQFVTKEVFSYDEYEDALRDIGFKITDRTHGVAVIEEA